MTRKAYVSKRTMRWAKLDDHYYLYRKAFKGQFESNFVPGAGNPLSRVVFVGEAPGKDEDHAREPFVGAAGKFLDRLLASVGIEREEIFITNLLKYRPPNNRDPLKDELPANLSLLRMELAIIDPDVVVTLGRFAAALYFPLPNMESIAGRVHVKQGRVVLPMYHPAAPMYRAPLYKKKMERDMFNHIKALPQILSNGVSWSQTKDRSRSYSDGGTKKRLKRFPGTS